MKHFYHGPLVNADLLILMLEKHNIHATQQDSAEPQSQEEDLNRLVTVFVPDDDYARAWQLFYSERQDEF